MIRFLWSVSFSPYGPFLNLTLSCFTRVGGPPGAGDNSLQRQSPWLVSRGITEPWDHDLETYNWDTTMRKHNGVAQRSTTTG